MPRAQCKDAAAAMRVFGEMKRSRVRPDVVSYTSLLTALEGTAQVGVQEAGIDGSGKAGTVPWGGDACLGSCAWLGAGLAGADGPHPGAACSACIITSGPYPAPPHLPLPVPHSAQAAPLARDVWHSMQRDGVQPNGMAIAAFLEILLLEGEIDEALQVGQPVEPCQLRFTGCARPMLLSCFTPCTPDHCCGEGCRRAAWHQSHLLPACLPACLPADAGGSTAGQPRRPRPQPDALAAQDGTPRQRGWPGGGGGHRSSCAGSWGERRQRRPAGRACGLAQAL